MNRTVFNWTEVMDVIGLDNNVIKAAPQDIMTQGEDEQKTFSQLPQQGSDGQQYLYKPPAYPDDLPDDSPEYLEGKKKLVSVNTYERNPAARETCIIEYGAVCYVCGFDFGKTYGVEFEGMIHVHHLNMLSKDDGEHPVNPEEDLRPVCPNCHMVLHSKKDGYTIDEVKAMLI